MKKILSSEWKMSVYALLVCLGGIIGALLFDLGIYYVLGCVTVLTVLVLINIISILYKKHKNNERRKLVR